MTLAHSLRQAGKTLAKGRVPDAQLEAELLLRHAMGIDRVKLYQDLEREIGPEEAEEYEKLVKRRLHGEPTAYIIGHREFYGLDFAVDPAVLIPRPETELLVEAALKLASQYSQPVIADIGTGSGAVAVSLVVNLPQAKIYATDISAPALHVARRNCEKHGVGGRVSLLQGDLLTPLPEAVDIIIANLPYVTADEISQTGLADFEPEIALNGGRDGLAEISRLCDGLNKKLKPGGTLLLEVGAGQSRAATGYLKNLFPEGEVTITPDLAGIERLISLSLA